MIYNKENMYVVLDATGMTDGPEATAMRDIAIKEFDKIEDVMTCDLKKTFEIINYTIETSGIKGHFLALKVAIIKTTKVITTTGGIDNVYIHRANGTLDTYPPSKLPALGVFPWKYIKDHFESLEIDFNLGDTIVLYTDEAEEELGLENILKMEYSDNPDVVIIEQSYEGE